MGYSKNFDKAIADYFAAVLRTNLKQLSILPFLFRTALCQKRAKKEVLKTKTSMFRLL